jgi:hypothetical protein
LCSAAAIEPSSRPLTTLSIFRSSIFAQPLGTLK